MKPILFNTEMVKSLLSGHKTVTRRVVKLKYSNTHLEMFTNKYGTRLIEKQNEEPGVTTIMNLDGTTTHKLLAYIEKTPPYRPGDILYVRETWAFDTGNPEDEIGTGVFVYKADCEESPTGKWYPSIHMPKIAARIFLRVTDVRVERLQDITDEDLVRDFNFCPEAIKAVGRDALAKPFWDSTIKPADRSLYGWDANPWVWVIEFERISREEALHMTDYAKMAAECREELARVERRLKQARGQSLLHRDFESEKAVSMWEDMRVELRVKIREFDRRAEKQGKE